MQMLRPYNTVYFMMKRFGFFLFFAFTILALGVFTQVSYAANGTSPSDALFPIGQAQTIAPHSAQWYKFDVGGKKAAVRATLDAPSADGLRLEIFTPEQIAAWERGDGLKSIGMGGPQQAHTLGWSGVFNQAGTFYAVAYNDNDAPVQVRVLIEGDSVTAGPPPPTPTRRPDPLITPTPLGKGINGKIVFVDATGGNIYTVNGDGTNLQRITFGMDPVWNHAGTQIAFARQGPIPGIYVIYADGSGERLLYQTQEPRAPAWSPDDSEIVFSYQGATKGGGERCFRGRCFQLPASTQWKLGAVNVADGTYHDVRAGENATTPTFAPDGTIAYNDTEIGLMTTTSRGEPAANPFIGDLRVTSDSYNPLRLVSPQYSPDGKLITYMVQQPPTWQIALANADGSNQHLLTKDVTLAYEHPNAVAPEWSPNSQQILFLANRNGKWEFFVMNADGSNVQQVLKNVTDAVELRYDYQAGRMMSWTQ